MYHIRIPDLIARLAKGDNLTVKEDKELREDIGALANESSWQLQDEKGRRHNLTVDQKTFVRDILPLFLHKCLPKLAEVCMVYGINMDSDTLICEYETSPYGSLFHGL